ncbi:MULTISPECIES: AAA family ATPase [unclassified Oceanobacillus]|uniref:AAA family ATPase n=1 Tax=unclassified Oceanobacillus TaxID=2630292 RepID=UPI001BEB5173|nr:MULTISPECIES: AAA family ATPase [unclassified Oceanobacillus]MBT2600908.1 AAA family ATPase [Oceanobacillus sp. ISL-74]MBT2653431.1 AAA family ATPase [Oceanobacillus sp. ISL-73]
MSLNITNAADIQSDKATYLIYAPPGMGKTTAIKYLPGKTLVLDVDRTTRVLKGEKNIDISYVSNTDTWEEWGKIIVDLEEKYNGVYDNIVVDNISELERCLLSDLGSKGKNKGVPSQGDYQYMQFRIVNSLRYMKNLNSNLVWTAWESTDLFTDSSGQQWNRSFPQINHKILNNILGLCDVVAKLAVNSEDKRGFILSATNSTYAKNQLDDRKGCLQSELIPVVPTS